MARIVARMAAAYFTRGYGHPVTQPQPRATLYQGKGAVGPVFPPLLPYRTVPAMTPALEDDVKHLVWGD